MRTNRRIYAESVNLFRRENDFCCLTSRQPSRLAQEIQYRGLKMLAQGPLAFGFRDVSMTIVLDPSEFAGRCSAPSRDSYTDQPWRYIFCVDELPTFCRLLLKFNKNSAGHLLQKTMIHIDINFAWKGQPAEMDRNAIGLSRLRRLLNPLHQLHSFGAAQIEGPLSYNYKRSVISSLCNACPTGLEVIQKAIGILSQGDEQVSQNRPTQALQLYGSALGYVRSCCWLYGERDLIINSGLFPGLTAGRAMYDLKIRLLARIASVYLDIGMSRMARIYVERARSSGCFRYSWSTGHNPSHLPDNEKSFYAEVIHVSARIYYTHGKVWEAFRDLYQAREFRPLDNEEQSRLDAWVKHKEVLDERGKKRDEACKKQREKGMKKTEGR